MITNWSIVITTLCLLGFWPILRIADYRSTSGHIVNAADYGNKQDPKARQCLYSCTVRLDSDDRMKLKDALKSSGRRTCFEKCLAGNKQGNVEFSYKKRLIPRNHHLMPFSTRKKRETNAGIITEICPKDTVNATNVYANVTSIEHRQYADSHRWYVNISWIPLNESLVNFTGYAFVYLSDPSSLVRYIKRQKNETYVVYDGPESTMNNYVFFRVIALPCQKIGIELKDKISPRNVTTGMATPSSTVKDTPKIDKTVYVIVAVGAFAVIVAIACVLRYKYFRKETSSRSAGFRFDAFIIFNNKDQSWVDGTLLPILEVKHGLKCCVHYRDFEPGRPFVDNMTDSVQNSKNTIAVVSENFFTSQFCKYELDQAIYKHVKEGYNSAIVIRIDDVSKDKLPDALKNKSFVDYSNLIERKTWHLKLIKVLKSNRNGGSQ